MATSQAHKATKPEACRASSQPFRLRLQLLPLAIMAVVATTMIPSGFRRPSLTFVDFVFDRSDIINNVLLYIPMGLALGYAPAARAVLVGFGLSAIAESFQLICANRDPSPVDVMTNTLGTLLGYLVAQLLRRYLGWSFHSIRLNRPLGFVAIGAGVFGIAALSLGHSNANFSNWDASYGLLAGDELTCDRPWRGTIRRLAIYSTPIGPDALQRLVSPLSPLPTGAIFTTKQFDTPLPSCPDFLLTGSKRDEFFQRLTQTNNISILLWFSTRSLRQHGPARMVTYSEDFLNRNFTLGQSGSSLSFRLRTPSTGLNGTDPAITTPPVLRAGPTYFAAAVFDGAYSRLYLDGKLLAEADLGAPRPRLPEWVVALLPPAVPLHELEVGMGEIFLGAFIVAGLLVSPGVPLPRYRIWLIAIGASTTAGLVLWAATQCGNNLGWRLVITSLVGGLAVAWSLEGGATHRLLKPLNAR